MSSSAFAALPLAPADPLFSLIAAYKADTFDRKVDLGVGAYRDDNAKPWVLPVVKKVRLLTPLLGRGADSASY
jgi:aspartate aminotransferase